MKKLILFTLLCICTTTSYAQESKLVGTWIGTYSFQHLDDDDNWFWADYKLYVRIYKYEEYRLKMKTVPVSSCSKCITTYYNELTITYVDDNIINFYERNDLGDNEICENYYSLTYSNGTLRIHPFKRIIIQKDKYGNVTERKDVTHMSAWIFKDVDLYKEETDW